MGNISAWKEKILIFLTSIFEVFLGPVVYLLRGLWLYWYAQWYVSVTCHLDKSHERSRLQHLNILFINHVEYLNILMVDFLLHFCVFMNDEWAKPTIEHNLINPYVQNISTNFLVLHVLNIAKHTYYYAPFYTMWAVIYPPLPFYKVVILTFFSRPTWVTWKAYNIPIHTFIKNMLCTSVFWKL